MITREGELSLVILCRLTKHLSLILRCEIDPVHAHRTPSHLLGQLAIGRALGNGSIQLQIYFYLGNLHLGDLEIENNVDGHLIYGLIFEKS